METDTKGTGPKATAEKATTRKATNPKGYLLLIGSLLLLICGGLWAQYKARFAWKDVSEKGIITVAKILRYETWEDGPNLTLEMYVGDKKYTTTIKNDDCDECVGNYYFVKTLREDPLKYPLMYMEDPVPNCVLSGVKSFDGWSDIPKCGTH